VIEIKVRRAIGALQIEAEIRAESRSATRCCSIPIAA
jgi:hypothetical protein